MNNLHTFFLITLATNVANLNPNINIPLSISFVKTLIFPKLDLKYVYIIQFSETLSFFTLVKITLIGYSLQMSQDRFLLSTLHWV